MGTARSMDVIFDKEDSGIFVGSVGIDIRTIDSAKASRKHVEPFQH
jgi:hypothetical protein